MKPNIIRELTSKASAMARHMNETYENHERLAERIENRSQALARDFLYYRECAERNLQKCKVLLWGNIIITILHIVLNLLSGN